MDIFPASLGELMAQLVFHSLVVALVIEALIKAWHFHNPLSRLRFRLFILLLPILAIPLYQALYPARGSSDFRQGFVLLDLQKWFPLRIWFDLPLWYLLAGVMTLSSALFFAYEVLPIFRRRFRQDKGRPHLKEEDLPFLQPLLTQVAKAFSRPVPRVFLLKNQEPVVYITGLREQRLYLSPSLAKLLDPDELKGVLAHEMAHIVRRDIWVSWVLLFFRALTFFNPVALVAFRRIIYENEKVCDDMAVRVTKDPLALASSIIKVYRATRAGPKKAGPGKLAGWFLSMASTLEQHENKALVEDRAERVISGKNPGQGPFEKAGMALTAAFLVALLFFVV